MLIQNSLANTVFSTPKTCHITPLLASLHWLKIKERTEYFLLHTTFLLRDAMQVRSMLSCSLSVRPSVTFVDHVKTNKLIFQIFSPSGSDRILVISYQTGCRYSDGNPLTGGLKQGGIINLRFFHKYLAVSQKR